MPLIKDLTLEHLKVPSWVGVPAIDSAKVAAIKESILTHRQTGTGFNGLLTPLKVFEKRNTDGRTTSYYVLSEFSVLKALMELGEPGLRVRCQIYGDRDHGDLQMELVSIDARIIQRDPDLDVIAAGKLYLRRDEVLSALGLRTWNGANQHTIASTPEIKTSAQIAEEAGVSVRTLTLHKQIAEGLHPDVEEVIYSLGMQNETTRLRQIVQAGHSKRAQEAELNRIIKQKSDQDSIRQARSSARSVARSAAPDGEGKVVEMSTAFRNPVSIVAGDVFRLGTAHFVSAIPTGSERFAEAAPYTSLAIAPILDENPDNVFWNHDWLFQKSHIVAVPVTPRAIARFFTSLGLPRNEPVNAFPVILQNGRKPSGAVTVFLFSQTMDSIHVPEAPPVVADAFEMYSLLMTSYSQKRDTILFPFLGQGDSATIEICGNNDRFIFTGSDDAALCTDVVNDWRKRGSGKRPARKISDDARDVAPTATSAAG